MTKTHFLDSSHTVAKSQYASGERSKSKLAMLLKSMLLLAFFIPPVLAYAAIVTNGFIKIAGFQPRGEFSLIGTDFNAGGNFSGGNWGPSRLPCIEPCSLSVHGIVVGNDFRTGQASIAGTSYERLIWGDIQATGSSAFAITGPDILLNAGAGTYASTFSFIMGSLCGTAFGETGSTHPCVADLPSLRGSGTVEVAVGEFELTPGRTDYYFKEATYTFSEPVSAPEINATSGTLAVALLFVVLLLSAETLRRRS